MWEGKTIHFSGSANNKKVKLCCLSVHSPPPPHPPPAGNCQGDYFTKRRWLAKNKHTALPKTNKTPSIIECLLDLFLFLSSQREGEIILSSGKIHVLLLSMAISGNPTGPGEDWCTARQCPVRTWTCCWPWGYFIPARLCTVLGKGGTDTVPRSAGRENQKWWARLGVTHKLCNLTSHPNLWILKLIGSGPSAPHSIWPPVEAKGLPEW